MQVSKAFKFKLIVSEEQAQTLRRWTGCNRLIYNLALAQRNLAYQLTKKSLNYETQANELTDLKNSFPYLKEPPAQTLQQTLKHLDSGFQRFFQKQASYPQFKKKSKSIGIHFPSPNQFSVTRVSKRKGIVDLPKIGPLKFWWSQPIKGKIRHAIITSKAGNWYISFNCLTDTSAPATSKPPIALDLGINVTVTTSQPLDQVTHHHLPLPKLKSLETKLANRQRVQALKKKFSKNWKKLNQQIAKIHHQLSCVRHDWIHKLSTKIAKNHGLIFVEDLDVQAMSANNSGTLEQPGTDVSKKTGLNRSILRQGWGELTRCLGYKGYWYGQGAWYVPPFNTSIRCHQCKFESKDNRIQGSTEFHCLRCGYETHADDNAAANIEEAGLALFALNQAKPVLKNQTLLELSS